MLPVMDAPVEAWWLFLCSVAALNVLLWVASLRRYQHHVRQDPAFHVRRWHLLLSGIYTLVCGFRGVLPRADVQRICLFDTYLSSIAVGRSVATVAEMCLMAQFALLAHEYARSTRDPPLAVLGKIMVVSISFAEVCSWYSVLTTNYIGNAMEESNWMSLGVLLTLCMLRLRKSVGPQMGRGLLVGLVGAPLFVTFMITVDIRMYVTRWLADEAAGRAYLTLSQGWQDINTRWVVTGSYSEWAPEMAWMGLYFSAAVWVSIALTHAPRPQRQP